jgi:hypothetical protein
MELLVKRDDLTAERTLGEMFIASVHECYTLERPLDGAVRAIPTGRYQVVLTVSGRAQQGKLWAPSHDGLLLDLGENMLPELLNVPNRTAIRIHALNFVTQTEGCIGVGRVRDSQNNQISESRPALVALMRKIGDTIKDGSEVWITV